MWMSYLDWGLADFSGYIAADELYDGPFCVLSIVFAPKSTSTTVSRSTCSAIRIGTTRPQRLKHSITVAPLELSVMMLKTRPFTQFRDCAGVGEHKNGGLPQWIVAVC